MTTDSNTDAVIHEIASERDRQVEGEGWTPLHDDGHDQGELADAAACYAWIAGAPDNVRAAYPNGQPPANWPWDYCWWKPKDRYTDLKRAGALIVAEMERLHRLENHP